MNKTYIIVGASGVGKSTTLRLAFDLPVKRWGIGTALKSDHTKNGAQYMPEMAGGSHNKYKEEINAFLANDAINVVDMNPRFPLFQNYIKGMDLDVEYILLDEPNAIISENLRSRPTNANTNMAEKIEVALKWQFKLRKKYKNKMTRIELTEWLNNLNA